MSLENVLGLDKKVVMEFKQVVLSLKTSLKIPLQIINFVRKDRENNFGWIEMDKTNCSL